MPSLDFENEKKQFNEFYSINQRLLEDAKDSFISLFNALLIHGGAIAISKIDGRVKNREECIRKFDRKYRSVFESDNIPYEIRDCISDLIGLRVVCLYEDDIEKIEQCLSGHFSVVERTDKISQIENTEGLFGYKGLHLDLKLNDTRSSLPEYEKYSIFRFEVQIRSIIQDSWSVLDHKIKYKKSIPTKLKRRINTLAALFELADREFREIRNSTNEEIEKEKISDATLEKETNESHSLQNEEKFHYSKLNAFSFMKIANHFFKDFEFEAHKVDGFTQEIVNISPNISRGKFNYYLRENISKVKKYQIWFEAKNQNDKLDPYNLIRHCLYFGEPELFSAILSNLARESIENWHDKHI